MRMNKFHISAGRGPEVSATFDTSTWVDLKWSPNGSCSVSARLRLSSAVFNSHDGWGVISNASVDNISSSSTSSSLGSGLSPVYREQPLRVFLTVGGILTGFSSGKLTQNCTCHIRPMMKYDRVSSDRILQYDKVQVTETLGR